MCRYPITNEGFIRMEAELKNLKNTERPEIINAIAVAREHGDLKENAEYHAAREKQGFIEARIKDLEAMYSRADIIDIADMAGNTVKFGATVKLVDEDTDEESTYQIVGIYEADLKQNKLSLTSPLSRALIGKKVEDSIEVSTPKGKKFYELLKISYIE